MGNLMQRHRIGWLSCIHAPAGWSPQPSPVVPRRKRYGHRGVPYLRAAQSPVQAACAARSSRAPSTRTRSGAKNAAWPSARCSGLALSGDTTPATTVLIISCTKACSDEARPRWCGYVQHRQRQDGKISAMPMPPRKIGSTAHGNTNCGDSAT